MSMSLFLLPIAVALLGAPQDAPTPPPAPSAEASADDRAGAALMEQVWRRYRRLASAAITGTGSRSYAGGRIEPIRTRVMLAPTGEAKVIGSSYNLTLKDGVAYADSPFFAGMQIRVKVGTGTDAAITAIADAWPVAMVPVSVRLRLATSPEAGFASLLEFAGDSPRVDAQAGVWTDGRACEILRIRSGDGATDLAVWVDQLTGLVRGVRGDIRGSATEPASTLEILYEATELDRAPMIAVANRGVRPVDSYDDLLRAWREMYAVPPAPPLAE
jgi:hypothetical protein